MKNVSTVALAILISLGVVACNSTNNHQAASKATNITQGKQEANAEDKKEGEGDKQSESGENADDKKPDAENADGDKKPDTENSAEGPKKPEGGDPNSSSSTGETSGDNPPNNGAAGGEGGASNSSGSTEGGASNSGGSTEGAGEGKKPNTEDGTNPGAGGSGDSGSTTSTENPPSSEPQKQDAPFVTLKNDSEKSEATTAIAKLTDTDKAAQDQESDTVKAMNDGDKIIGYKQSYASYIAVLSGSGDDKIADYYVGFGEEGISKAKDIEVTELSGTYIGKISVTNTEKEDEDYLGTYNTDVNFTVNNSRISGSATFTPEAEKPTETVVFTFNEAEIKKESDALGFSGKLAIRNNTKPEEQNGVRDMTGTYRGLFAGEKANQLAGTLDEDSKRLSGAFAAEKQEQTSP